jgi:uncharacterized membrane protein
MAGLLDFLGQRWFDGAAGQQPGQQPPAGPQSLFPLASDPKPIDPTGPKGGGWGGIASWLQGPAHPLAPGGGLTDYQPVSRIETLGDTLMGAAKGVLGARGPYSNWLGQGLVGAGEGLEESRQRDLKLRALAQEQQLKNVELILKAQQARTEAAKAGAPTITSAEGSVFQTDPFTHETKLVATAPAKPMGEAEKVRLETELARLEEDKRYHGVESQQAAERLGVERGRLAVDQAAAGVPKSADERDRASLLSLSGKLGRGETLGPDERALYERLYRGAAADKTTMDPTGLVTRVTPDVSDLARPPSMAATPAPAAGLSQAPQGFPREQLQDTTKKYTAFKGVTQAVDSITGLLAGMSPGERLSSDAASKVNIQATALINALAAAGNTGVIQEGEAKRYMAELGELTGPMAAGRQALGIDRTKATMGEVKKLLRQAVKSAAPAVGSPQEAQGLPKGTPFVTPNGRLAVIGADGQAQLLDEE